MRTAFLLLLATPLLAQESYPSITLKNVHLSMSVMTPDAAKGFYRGSRFDWSGVLRDIQFQQHTFFKAWKSTHNPANHDDITGPCEEFRIPVGYDEAKEGETFLKIGVGTLVKPKEEKYRYAHNYEIKFPGTWEVSKDNEVLSFKQGMLTKNGYGYKYTKKLELLNTLGGFTITHELTNAGTKPLVTDWYNHNFYNVNGEAIGTNLTLTLPFAAKAVAPKERFAELVTIRDRTLTLNGALNEGSIFAELEGFGRSSEDHAFSIFHSTSRCTLSVKGDEPLSKFLIWGMKTTLCPEPYIAINLKPGETKTWSLTYKFSIGRGGLLVK